MKLDTHFSFIRVCPETNFQLTENEHAYSKGICPVCGHDNGSTFTHSKKIAGKWDRPNLFERKFQSKVAKFYTKEELNE